MTWKLIIKMNLCQILIYLCSYFCCVFLVAMYFCFVFLVFCVTVCRTVLQIFTWNINLFRGLYGRVLSHLLPYITESCKSPIPLYYGRVLSHLLPYITESCKSPIPLYYGKGLSHLLPLYYGKVLSTFLDIRITLWTLGSRIKNDFCILSDCTRSTCLGLPVGCTGQAMI